ncbi:biotin-dependent carboxyltransferase family protein [Natranaerobius trueperi]|uniref:KipI antagonist n=1 Tax=Natranaerobius trueperi TaxID=759412 RepID=A0A226BXC3_9FIRM|nr:biotin-dependent carboxyltransferase family protein [Natranaerobius trueperi]OWZ82849.1 KipI antagonist [Natranaerobius trueperi]
MIDTIKVIHPGMFTTVQDLGRYGYQAYGMPVAGAVDSYALRVGNALLNNPDNTAGLEMTIMGPKLEFLKDTMIAITGADLGAKLNGVFCPSWEAIYVKAGDVLTFSGLRTGCRGYLTVAGGILVPEIMESKSTYTRAAIGGFEGRSLQKEDFLKTKKLEVLPTERNGLQVPKTLIPSYDSKISLRVVSGPQEDHFTEAGIETLLSSEYNVTNEADRMGYRLEGPKIEHQDGADIISDGIPIGAVQVPGHGFPIVMLNDRQTTGGYTKIATVISTDLKRIGQGKPGDKVTFESITQEEATGILKEEETAIKRIYELISENDDSFALRHELSLRINGKAYHVRVEELSK